MIQAGYETSASTMTWALYELSKRPDQQARIRREISEARSRSDIFSPQDYDGMQFMSAVIKVYSPVTGYIPIFTDRRP